MSEAPNRPSPTRAARRADEAPARTTTIKLSALRRIVVAVLVLFTAWHVAVTFLWIAPDSEARDFVPGGEKTLSAYMKPLFGQSWSVFAPSPVDGDYYLEVRAAYNDDSDESTTTDWVNATEVELSTMHHNPFPARASWLATRYSQRLYSAYAKLNDDQKNIASKSFYKGDAPWTRLRDALKEDDGDIPTAYFGYERDVAAYATQVAEAVWGEDGLDAVQVRVQRQGVVPYAKRNDPDAKRPNVVTRDIGWRAPFERDGQSSEQFADYFCSAPKEVC